MKLIELDFEKDDRFFIDTSGVSVSNEATSGSVIVVSKSQSTRAISTGFG